MSDGGRGIPNARVRRLMLAIEDVMGQSGLATILRQANLQRFASALPPANAEPALRAAEYASLMQAIENYYGRGGRGTLTRVGYAAFDRLVAGHRLTAAAYRLLFKFLPLRRRQMVTLHWLGGELAGRGGRATVYLDDNRISLERFPLACTADFTRGSQRNGHDCHKAEWYAL